MMALRVLVALGLLALAMGQTAEDQEKTEFKTDPPCQDSSCPSPPPPVKAFKVPSSTKEVFNTLKSALSKMFNGWLNGILHLIQFFQTLYGHDPLCNGSKEYFDCEIGEVILVVLAAVAKTVTGTIIIDSKILGILFGAFFNVLNAIIGLPSIR